jgi:hypothetical protein
VYKKRWSQSPHTHANKWEQLHHVTGIDAQKKSAKWLREGDCHSFVWLGRDEEKNKGMLQRLQVPFYFSKAIIFNKTIETVLAKKF